MEFMELAKSRYSVRKYAEKPVEEEKLAAILEAGNVAPTAKNIQPQRIYVVRTPEMLAKLAELTPCTFNAPVVIAYAFDEDEVWRNPIEDGIDSGAEDVSIVATHHMLMAQELGLGTCWVNFMPNSKVEEALGLPANETLVLLLTLGYAAEGDEPSPRHAQRKPLQDTVRFL